MSQSSETMKSELLMLGYPEQMFANEYYTAKVAPEHGICVAKMIGAYFVQFFPWGPEPLTIPSPHPTTGHHRYTNFIMRQASSLDDKYKDLPYYKLALGADLLTIKCVIEEGIKQCQPSSK
jgi:hypothetical protein